MSCDRSSWPPGGSGEVPRDTGRPARRAEKIACPPCRRGLELPSGEGIESASRLGSRDRHRTFAQPDLSRAVAIEPSTVLRTMILYVTMATFARAITVWFYLGQHIESSSSIADLRVSGGERESEA